MSRLLIILLAFFLEYTLINAEFSLSIAFHQYTNPHRFESTGQCCDCHSLFTCNPCTAPCDTKFDTLCLRLGSISHTQVGQCIPGTILSPGSVGGDNIQFSNSIGSLSNPFEYGGSSIPQHGYQLYLQVIDEDTVSVDDPIDRIIINISPNPSTTVISRNITGVYSIASLQMSYILNCDQHYYGSDCSINCVPHNDDINGHYTCDNTGAVICKEGWQNPGNFCREVECTLRCNSEGGECINGSCVCNGGWSGDGCGTPQCAMGCNPQGGYCNVPDECICNQNWNGTNCTISLCAVNCSSIGGICSTPNKCTCLEGYTGDSCETDMLPCDNQMPCFNNATCSLVIDYVGEYTCSCLPGYTGVNCHIDVDECAMEPCYNNGTCLNEAPGSFKCICPQGWTGEICKDAIDYCVTNPCMNNGLCYSLSYTHFCNCSIGYEGYNCEIEVNACLPNPCQNNATCINHHTNFSCICIENYSGRYCQYFNGDIVTDIVTTTVSSSLLATNVMTTSELAVVSAVIASMLSALVLVIFFVILIVLCIYLTLIKKSISKSSSGSNENATEQIEMSRNFVYDAASNLSPISEERSFSFDGPAGPASNLINTESPPIYDRVQNLPKDHDVTASDTEDDYL